MDCRWVGVGVLGGEGLVAALPIWGLVTLKDILSIHPHTH